MADVLVVLKVTEFAPVKLLPLIVTRVPAAPCFGLKLETSGGGGGAAVTVKVSVLVSVPPGVATVTLPVVAPFGTVVVI